VPLIERDYMRNPARTRAEQRRRRPRFSMPPLVRQPPRPPPSLPGACAQDGDPGGQGRGLFWMAYAAIVVSVGVIGAFVALAVREVL